MNDAVELKEGELSLARSAKLADMTNQIQTVKFGVIG